MSQLKTRLEGKIHDAVINNAMKNGYTLKAAKALADAVVAELDHETVLGLVNGTITTLALMEKVQKRLHH